MLGCTTILYPLEQMNRSTYAKSLVLAHIPGIEFDLPGIAYGDSPSEIERAAQTRPLVRSILLKANAWGKKVTVRNMLADVRDQIIGGADNPTYGIRVQDIWH